MKTKTYNEILDEMVSRDVKNIQFKINDIVDGLNKVYTQVNQMDTSKAMSLVGKIDSTLDKLKKL